LHAVANRLQRPEVQHAFAVWLDLLILKHERDQYTKLNGLQKSERDLQTRCSQLEEELKRLRTEASLQASAAERQRSEALQRQLTELTGSATEIAEIQSQEEREARVELLRRQITRRILNRSISLAWTAWLEMWEARNYATARLREARNKLSEPELTVAFSYWKAISEQLKGEKAWKELEVQSKSLDASLRRSRYENKQMGMHKVALEDEIRALREELAEFKEEKSRRDTQLAGLAHLPDDMERLRVLADKAERDASEAIHEREEAERDVLRQLDSNQALLEKLMKEQRDSMMLESRDLKKRLASETEQRLEAEAALSRFRDESGRKERAAEVEKAKLKADIAKLTTPPPPPKPKPVKTNGRTMAIDLDEGPDAPPVAEQLAAALRDNATRVLDLFRSWDSDGDGQVSRAEFHRAMPALGLDVPKPIIDDLFSEWDKDGGGELGYQELRKILSSSQHTPVDKSRGGKSSPTVSSNTAKPVSSAAKAIKAVNKLKK